MMRFREPVRITDITALDPEHDMGPCKYDSTRHPIGLVVNSTLAIAVAGIATYLILSGLDFLAGRAALRRERAMIDVAIAERSPG